MKVEGPDVSGSSTQGLSALVLYGHKSAMAAGKRSGDTARGYALSIAVAMEKMLPGGERLATALGVVLVMLGSIKLSTLAA